MLILGKTIEVLQGVVITHFAAWHMNFCTGKLYAILILAHDGKFTVH